MINASIGLREQQLDTSTIQFRQSASLIGGSVWHHERLHDATGVHPRCFQMKRVKLLPRGGTGSPLLLFSSRRPKFATDRYLASLAHTAHVVLYDDEQS